MTANLYLLVAMLAWGSWQIFAKIAMRHLSPVEAQAIYTLSGVLFVPVYLYGKGAFQRLPFSWMGVGCAVAASVVGTVATLAYSTALTTKDASSAIVAVAAYPIITVMLAVLILGETLTWAKVVGLLLVIMGVAVAR